LTRKENIPPNDPTYPKISDTFFQILVHGADADGAADETQIHGADDEEEDGVGHGEEDGVGHGEEDEDQQRDVFDVFGGDVFDGHGYYSAEEEHLFREVQS